METSTRNLPTDRAELIRLFLALPQESLPSARYEHDQDDRDGDAWADLRADDLLGPVLLTADRDGWRVPVRVAAHTSALTVYRDPRSGLWTITDSDGGVWWATVAASERIDDAGDEATQNAECLRLMREDASAGTWHQ